MSKAKINNWEATKIAQAIASKAFAHIDAPFIAREKELAKLAYRALLYHLDTSEAALLSSGICNSGSTCRLKVYSYNDDEGVELQHAPGVDVICGFNYNSFKVVNDHIYTELKVLQLDWADTRIRKNAFVRDSTNMLDKKSANAAKKAWPEVADIINEVLDIDADVPMVVPLEALLAKFLPMLAAPKEEPSDVLESNA